MQQTQQQRRTDREAARAAWLNRIAFNTETARVKEVVRQPARVIFEVLP
jgi:hypothetical protein